MRRNATALHSLARRARPAMGWAFVAVGLSLLLGLNHALEGAALRVLPAWIIDLSVSI